jgi:hypothetical protein
MRFCFVPNIIHFFYHFCYLPIGKLYVTSEKLCDVCMKEVCLVTCVCSSRHSIVLVDDPQV